MVRKRLIGLLILSLFITGCNTEIADLFPDKKNTAENLLRVEITFTDGQSLIGYVKQLGIEQQQGKVYVGGSSLNYLYNQKGEVIGSYNYQRVLYMMIIPQEVTD